MAEDEQPNQKTHWHIKKEITYSHIITTALLVVGALQYANKVDARIGLAEFKIEAASAEAKDLETRTTASFAEIKDQLNRIEDKIDNKVDRRTR